MARWMKEAPRFMAQSLIAETPDRKGTPAAGARRSGLGARLAVALPLLVLLIVLALPGVASAGGGPGPGRSVAVTPASGPVGTHVTVTGSHFPSGHQVIVGYSSGDCSANVITITDATGNGATGTVGGNGSVTIVIVWPNTQPGKYTICVKDTTANTTTASATKFEVTSASAPSITVSPNPVGSGQQVTVTGANFMYQPGGGSVEILYGDPSSNGCTTSAGVVTNVNPDGSFTFQFNVPTETATTTLTVEAVSPQGTCGQSPVLEAHQSLTVSAAVTPTATPAVVVAATPTPTSPLPFPPPFPPTGAWIVVYCLVGLLVLLLFLLLLLLLMRRRRSEEPVTIEERDNVVVNAAAAGGAGGAVAGSAMVQRQIVARDARGNETPIAEEIYRSEDEIIDDPDTGGPGGGGNPPTPRYGPPLDN